MMLLSDSALPCGGFVASAGLEAASQLGLISPNDNVHSLWRFITSSLDSYYHMQLKFVALAWEASRGEDSCDVKLQNLVDLDGELDSYLLGNAVSRQASLTQGGGLLVLASKCLQRYFVYQENAPLLTAYSEASREAQWPSGSQSGKEALKTPGHQSVALGLIFYSLGLTLDQTKKMALFWHVRTLVSAAVRLNLLGPFGGQRLLAELQGSVEHYVNLKLNVYEPEWTQLPASTSPFVEITSSSHQNLYSKMFNS